MRSVFVAAFLLISIIPIVSADDAGDGAGAPNQACQGHEGDSTPIHTGSDERGEYVALNQNFDTCTSMWYNPGEKTYIGPLPCLGNIICL